MRKKRQIYFSIRSLRAYQNSVFASACNLGSTSKTYAIVGLLYTGTSFQRFSGGGQSQKWKIDPQNHFVDLPEKISQLRLPAKISNDLFRSFTTNYLSNLPGKPVMFLYMTGTRPRKSEKSSIFSLFYLFLYYINILTCPKIWGQLPENFNFNHFFLVIFAFPENREKNASCPQMTPLFVSDH